MNWFQIIMLLLSFAGGTYLFSPAIGRVAGWIYQGGASLLGRGSLAASTAATPIAGVPVKASGVTAEQAQAAELTLARYLSQTDKSDPVYKLILNGITTLAAEQKPNATA